MDPCEKGRSSSVKSQRFLIGCQPFPNPCICSCRPQRPSKPSTHHCLSFPLTLCPLSTEFTLAAGRMPASPGKFPRGRLCVLLLLLLLLLCRLVAVVFFIMLSLLGSGYEFSLFPLDKDGPLRAGKATQQGCSRNREGQRGRMWKPMSLSALEKVPFL